MAYSHTSSCITTTSFSAIPYALLSPPTRWTQPCQACEVFCCTGHTSPVISLCFSPSGRYVASCSDIGERAIRVWFAGMPVYDRPPIPLGLRLRWGRSGLVKHLKANAEASALAFFLSRQEERESRESSDESAGEKVMTNSALMHAYVCVLGVLLSHNGEVGG